MWLGTALWVVLAFPPIRLQLESTMTLQMLVQIPLLVLVGWVGARVLPPRMQSAVARWDVGGIPGLLIVSFTSAVWMLPRMLDAAVDIPLFAAAKFITVPVLIGVPLALSWPRTSFVTRGVFLLETVASAFRLGWLYLVAPDRLCANYLLGDQQILGRSLLGIGIAMCLVLAWQLMWGHIRVTPTPQRVIEPATF